MNKSQIIKRCHGSINFELRYFIADFYCAEKKLVLELDGEIHSEQKEYDENRDEIINGLGLQVGG